MTDARKTVLVVDDDAVNRLVLCEMLDMEGYATIEAADGVEAVAAALESRPAAILMDINMPRMTGIEALVRLRERDPAMAARAVAVTADVTSANRDACLAAGFVCLVQKPIEIDTVMTALHRALGG